MYNNSDRVLYPMLGVGAFFALFWTGFVVGYELGWSCDLLLLGGFLCGTSGAYLIARQEHRDSRTSRSSGVCERTGGAVQHSDAPALRARPIGPPDKAQPA